MSAENALQLPIVELVDGEEVKFPRLDMNDLIEWAGQLRNRRRIEAETRMKANQSLSPLDRERLIQEIVDQDVELATLMVRSYTPEGIRKVMVASLKKGGVADQQALETLKRIHFKRQAELTRAILSPPAPEVLKGDDPSPLTESDTAGTSPLSELS
jgi:hypothetical protein